MKISERLKGNMVEIITVTGAATTRLGRHNMKMGPGSSLGCNV